MASDLRYAAMTHPGLKRSGNEDSYAIAPTATGFPISFVLADGMGGHQHGEVASELAATYCKEQLSLLTAEENSEEMQEVLLDLVQKANVKVYLTSLENIRNSGMGTTINLAVFYPNAVYATHIGDSRLYLMRNNKLEALSTDHTVVQEMLAAGSLTWEQSLVHPNRHILTQALGAPEYLHPDFLHMDLLAKDRFILRSDGLHGYVPEDEIARVVSKASDPEECCKQLVDLSLNAGGSDNVTVISIFN